MRQSHETGCCVAVALAVAVAAGCGDDGRAVVDGGGDAGPDTGVAIGPSIPWLEDGAPPVELTPCPPGWREVPGVVTTCHPYPEAGAMGCGDGEAHFPGEAECRPVGDPCPVGPFAEGLPAGAAIIYVDAAAPAGGDGSLAAPFTTLSEVSWSSLPADTTVALARGTYEGVVALRAGVQVVGGCAAETILTGTSAPVVSVVSVTSGGAPATLRNVTIRDAEQRGVRVEGGRALELEGVVLDAVSRVGVDVREPGTTVSATDVVIRGARPEDGLLGFGVLVVDGARFEGSRIIVEANHDAGVAVIEGGSASLRDAVVRDTQPRPSDLLDGRGINVAVGAEVETNRVLVEANHLLGVFVGGGRLNMTDTVIADTLPQMRDGEGGAGLAVFEGAEVEASRLVIRGNRDFGLNVHGAGTTITITDLVITDTSSIEAIEEDGRGIGVRSGARLTADRVLVARNREVGVSCADPDSELVLRDALILDTMPRESTLIFGYGLGVIDGAQLVGERLVVDQAREAGLITIADGRAEITDLSISNVMPSESSFPTRAYGHGIMVIAGAADVSNFTVHDAHTCGLLVSESEEEEGVPSLDARSGTVHHTEIGACVQVEDYDFERLETSVAYSDNGVNLDTTMLPVPSFR